MEVVNVDEILKLLEYLGCTVQNESWYDEEGVEVTRITLPDGKELAAYGWGRECDFNDLVYSIAQTIGE